MKKLLVSMVLLHACAYGMENENVIPSHEIALENSDSTCIIIQSNDNLQKKILDIEFLPEAWYRQIVENKLVQEYDKVGNPLITFKNISSKVLPLVKNALYLMKFILLASSERKATQLAYTNFQALNLSLDKAAALLVALDYLRVPRPLIAGLARLFVQLTQGEEPDLGSLNDEIKKEINRYFYLFYNKDIEEEPQGERHLDDLIEFGKLNQITILLKNNTELNLSKQKLASICNISKLTKLGIITTYLQTLHLDNNQLQEAPTNLINNCPQLQYLYLSNNKLKSVSSDLVSKCPKLIMLHLNNNQLEAVPKDLVKHCPELILLNLSHNQLKAVPKKLVKHCPRLMRLDLASNQLKEISTDLVSKCSELRIFDLSNNQLMSLPITSLENLNNIKELYIMNNSLNVDTKVLTPFLQQAISSAEEKRQTEDNTSVKEKSHKEDIVH